MARVAASAITGLCAAPLFGTLGFWLASLSLGPGGGSDASIANAYMALLIGILSALGGGVGAALVIAFRLPPRLRPHLYVGDALLVAAMIVGWLAFVADPSPLEYADARPSLEAEIRLPAALGSDGVGAITFSEGLLDSRHDELIRHEGEYIVLPWETTPYRVKAWTIHLLLEGEDNWTRFDLDLPARPAQSTDWSPWLSPTPGKDLHLPGDVTLRFRFRLIPYGQ